MLFLIHSCTREPMTIDSITLNLPCSQHCSYFCLLLSIWQAFLHNYHQSVSNITEKLFLALRDSWESFSQPPALKCSPCPVPTLYVTFCSFPLLWGLCFLFFTITLSHVAIVKPHYKSSQYWTNFITGLVIKFNTNYNIVVHEKYCNRTVISC